MKISTQQSRYKCFRQFNKMPLPQFASSSRLVDDEIAGQYFNSNSLQDRLVRALGQERALPVKELLESFEFFERVRKYVRRPVMADLCCGHGLTGILFALFERSVEHVSLIDRRISANQAKVLDCAIRVGPWVAEKVCFKTMALKRALVDVSSLTSVIAIHACGVLTDHCLDCALATQGPVAVMPCCYASRHGCRAPDAIRLAFGPELARDVHRTYQLENAGYRVRWDYIPNEITPMNRILMGTRPSKS